MQPEQPVVLREQFALPRSYVAPITPIEQRLAEIWCSVLSMDCVGIEDDYTDLGGDSFMATLIFAEIRKSFGVTLPLATLLNASTIEKLAQAVDAASNHKVGSE